MKEVPLRVPLSVTLQNGMMRQFCGPYDALGFLENEWPNHGAQRGRGISACRAALRHPDYSESARISFIAACIEASLACSGRIRSAKLSHHEFRRPSANRRCRAKARPACPHIPGSRSSSAVDRHCTSSTNSYRPRLFRGQAKAGVSSRQFRVHAGH